MGTLRNSVQLIGRPGSDPEIKVFGENNRKLAKFNLATTERSYNDKHEPIDITQWHSIVAWSPFAETVEKFVRKGKRVAISGSLHNNQYEDKNDKSKKITHTEIVIDDLVIIDYPNEAQQTA